MNKIKTSVKLGGLVGIIDHVAPIGSGEQAFQTLHRIDPQLIKDKMQQWGFTLICEANFLTNSGKLSMWEETVKVKTNRAIMKFTKKT
jgi:predicted methyltransferase